MFPGHHPRRYLAPVGLFVFLLALATAPARAADDISEMTNTCSVSGGTATSSAEHFTCCWPDWGCVHCAVSDGAIYADQCWTDCDSQACRDANAGDRLGLPQTKKPPAASVPGGTPGSVAPAPDKKLKLPATPGADTLQ